MADMHTTSLARAVPAALALALTAGCASTQLDAQWADPQLSPNALRGVRVMVACEAYDAVIKRICQDQLAAEVVARGPARSAGARAVMTSYIVPSAAAVSPGLSLGIGGFGFGGGGFGGGVGVSAPIGGGRVTTGYSSSVRLTDAASGRLLWTAKASAPPSNDLNSQLNELTRAVFGAADKAGLF
jgi:hypothetical protein